MAYIGRQSGNIGNYVRCSALTADGSTTTFALTNNDGGAAVAAGSENRVICSVSGVIQTPGTSFSISGTNIVFASAPLSTDTIDFVLVLGESVSIGTPSDGTVTDAKLAGNISNSKLQHSAITINGSAVSLGGSTTITTITRPTISTSSAVIAPSTNASFTLTGANFVSVPIVELISSTGAVTRASAVTFNNATSLTVTTNLAAGNYFVRVENNDGGAVRSSSAILAVSAAPVWQTAAGSLGTIVGGATQSFTLLAYDDDSTAVTGYSLVSGSLPGGFSLAGDSTIGTISGTESGATATTTYSFTIRATDNENQTTDRAFSITVSLGAQGGGQFN
tara:strand:- start:191 stop:1195 length:1005 start_codon:yes stop_codon:yes gene_type:complete